jgi:hypothetical protein
MQAQLPGLLPGECLPLLQPPPAPSHALLQPTLHSPRAGHTAGESTPYVGGLTGYVIKPQM